MSNFSSVEITILASFDIKNNFSLCEPFGELRSLA
jgi:hypothetical protein